MALTDLRLFEALRTKMQWHQSRQSVLAENVANADTPGYRSSDLKALNFDATMKLVSAGVGTAKTHPNHLSLTARSGSPEFQEDRVKQFEVTPDGNGVSLEEQMMKVAANQMDYQAATTIYSRSLGLLRMAVKRG